MRGAWIGVVQALVGCGESGEQPMQFYRSCTNSECWLEQYFRDVE